MRMKNNGHLCSGRIYPTFFERKILASSVAIPQDFKEHKLDLKKIYSNLGMQTDLSAEILRFNNRLEHILKDYEDGYWKSYRCYPKFILKEIFFEAGWAFNEAADERLSPLIKKDNTESSLRGNLFFLQLLLGVLSKAKYMHTSFSSFYPTVEEIFNLTQIDIGFFLKNGVIMKTAAKEIDEKLIIENLDWLKDYPDSREKFSNALKYYLTKGGEADAITNAYSALEGVVKTFLDTKVRLDNEKTKNELLKKLNLPSEWGRIVNNYCEIAHEFGSRHGKKQQTSNTTEKIEPELVEFYIYITGTFIRLISRKCP